MGYKHTNLAVEADGVGFYDLGFPGCRPDVSPDGRSVVWCPDEKVLWGGDLDLTLPAPKVTNRRIIFAQSGSDIFQQQADWSPDGRFIAFGRGPQKGGGGRYPVEPGCPAKGWNICIGDLTGKWLEITTDGNHNKEPDWVPVPTVK
jgi:Tol biopolymer transport system component